MEPIKNTDINFLITQIKKDLEKEYQRKMRRRVVSARNINKILDKNISFGEKLADKVATIGGSWAFISTFCIFLVAWMILNTFILMSKAFDPFPYILLNLCLSCLAALQAPVIMMSQNRQAKKDRYEAEEDFQTNTRSEVQIQQIIAKLDLFMELFIKVNFEQKEDQYRKLHQKLDNIQDKLNSLNNEH